MLLHHFDFELSIKFFMINNIANISKIIKTSEVSLFFLLK